MQTYIPLLARIFLSIVFIKSGVDKLLDPENTRQTMESAGIPFSGILLVPTIIVLIAGGLSVLVGYWARYGALLLVGFLIPATLIFHTDFSQGLQQIQFLKNLGLMGGLLMVFAYGAGRWSLSDRGTSETTSSSFPET
jgi:putative oxidoreductase